VRHSLVDAFLLSLCLSCLLLGIDSIIEPLDVVLVFCLFDEAVALAID